MSRSVVLASFVALCSLACGGSSDVEEAASRELAEHVPSYSDAPTFAMEVPGAVAGKPDLNAAWSTSDTFQQVQDKFSALDTKGWNRGYAMNDGTSFAGLWTTQDGKLSASVLAMADVAATGKTSVTVVVSNLP